MSNRQWNLVAVKRRTFLNATTATMLLSLVGMQNVAALPRRKVGLVYDPLFLENWRESDHPESPQRYQAVMDSFAQGGILERTSKIEPTLEIEHALRAVHSEAHIQSIQYFYASAHQVALCAVGAAVAAVDAVGSSAQDQVFCVVRPPGHHALNSGREEGFCYYNNVAVAARYAQSQYQYEKILIVDWDYHHGNGTEAIFYEDPSVFFFSTHDAHAYPHSGNPAKIGAGKGQGYNLNVHLDCNARDEDIIRVFNDKLAPAVHRFKPDLVLVSAGFDSRKDDLLGCFDITDSGFASLTRIVRGFADTYCGGAMVSLLEGGYNLSGLASAATTHVEAMLEIS